MGRYEDGAAVREGRRYGLNSPGRRREQFSRRRSMRRPRPGLVSRDSGGSGTPPGRHYDRSARSSLDRNWHKARLVPESAAPIEPKVAASGAPGGAFLLTKEEGDASQASHRAASP